MLNRKKIIAFITILLISSTTFLAYPRELDHVIPEAEAQALPSPDLDNLLWSQTYGGTDYDWGNFVQITSDGDYIVVGDTYSFNVGVGTDVYLVKIQPPISQPITTTTSTTTKTTSTTSTTTKTTSTTSTTIQIDPFIFPLLAIIIAIVITGIAIAFARKRT